MHFDPHLPKLSNSMALPKKYKVVYWFMCMKSLVRQTFTGLTKHKQISGILIAAINPPPVTDRPGVVLEAAVTELCNKHKVKCTLLL